MSEHLHTEIMGKLGVVTLDRPKALNALNEGMVHKLSIQLADWREDDRVDAVVIRAVPGRAFCAGGDIRHVMETVRDVGVEAALPFFDAEYQLNWRIHAYPKPFIALIDGIVMGGGVGISVHGRHRIVTENTMFAMPETGIGMFPDVGGSYFLPRLPKRLGYYLGLSGRRLHGADCVPAGIATAFVPAERLATLFDRLVARTDGAYARDIEAVGEPTDPIDDLLDRTETLFAAGPLASKLARIGAADPELLRDIETKSPMALAVTKEQLDRGAQLDFESCMAMERDLVGHILQFPDFAEGVRAQIVDKDRQPKWQHATLADVTAEQVGRCFEPSAAGLRLGWDH